MFRHVFSDGAGFTYTSACTGQGAYCTCDLLSIKLPGTLMEIPVGGEASCNTAFKQSDDTCVQVGCSEDNVRLHHLCFQPTIVLLITQKGWTGHHIL